MAPCNKTTVKYNENLMSLLRSLDDVSSFMSTVDVFADSPQGGWGGKDNSQRTWRMAEFNVTFMSPSTGGWRGKDVILPGGEGRGLEPWNIYIYIYIHIHIM